MSKAKTPMSSLRANFNNFEEIMKSNQVRFNLWEAHERDAFVPPESRWYDEQYKNPKKAIMSDFIRVYNLGDDSSVGFMFEYKDKPTEDQMVSISCKFNDEVSTSKGFSVEEVRALFKTMNKDLKAKEELKASDVLSYVVETIITPRLLSEAEIEESKKEVEESIKQTAKSFLKSKQAQEKSKQELDDAKRKFTQEVNNSEEYKRVQELTEALSKAKSALIMKESEVRSKYKLNDLGFKNEKINREVAEINTALEKEKKEALKKTLNKAKRSQMKPNS